MSYISDYKHGGDYDEYEQCAAEENRRDLDDREWYYDGFPGGDVNE